MPAQADANHDSEGYLLDASGNRATVGNQAAVLAAIAKSAPGGGIVTAGDSAVAARDASFSASEAADKAKSDTEALSNMSPKELAVRRIQQQDAATQFDQNRADTQDAFAQHQAALHDQHIQDQDTLAQAQGYYDLAERKALTARKISDTTDAANFMTGFHQLTGREPDWEQQVAAGIAANPGAVNDPGVKTLLALGSSVRDHYLAANNQLQKQQTAVTTDQDALIQKHAEAGNLTRADFEGQQTTNPDGTISYTPSQKNFYNPDNTLNRPAVLALAAERAAKNAGQKEDNVLLRHNQSVYESLTKIKATGGDLTADDEARRVQAGDYISQHGAGKPSTVTGAPAAAPSPTPTKSASSYLIKQP